MKHVLETILSRLKDKTFNSLRHLKTIFFLSRLLSGIKSTFLATRVLQKKNHVVLASLRIMVGLLFPLLIN